MNERELSVFYDGACPVCALEMAMLRRRDVCSRLHAIDISALLAPSLPRVRRHGRSGPR